MLFQRKILHDFRMDFGLVFASGWPQGKGARPTYILIFVYAQKTELLHSGLNRGICGCICTYVTRAQTTIQINGLPVTPGEKDADAGKKADLQKRRKLP